MLGSVWQFRVISVAAKHHRCVHSETRQDIQPYLAHISHKQWRNWQLLLENAHKNNVSGLLKWILTPRRCRGMLHIQRVSCCISLQQQFSPQLTAGMVQEQGPLTFQKLKTSSAFISTSSRNLSTSFPITMEKKQQSKKKFLPLKHLPLFKLAVARVSFVPEH